MEDSRKQARRIPEKKTFREFLEGNPLDSQMEPVVEVPPKRLSERSPGEGPKKEISAVSCGNLPGIPFWNPPYVLAGILLSYFLE